MRVLKAVWLSVVALAACQVPNPAFDERVGMPGIGGTGGMPMSGMGGSGGNMVSTGMVLWLQFENQVANAASSQLTVTWNNGQFVDGPDGRALRLNNGRIHVAESPEIDSEALTINVWVKPRAFPSGSDRMTLFDNHLQYGCFLYSGGRTGCTNRNRVVERDGLLQIGVWSSITFTLDNSGMAMWHDGQLVGTDTSPGGNDAARGDMGLSFGEDLPSGENLAGDLDNIQIWTRVLTAEEICSVSLNC